jgi:hypothetical protein
MFHTTSILSKTFYLIPRPSIVLQKNVFFHLKMLFIGTIKCFEFEFECCGSIWGGVGIGEMVCTIMCTRHQIDSRLSSGQESCNNDSCYKMHKTCVGE